MAVRVFEYGALSPVEGAEVVRDQMSKAHRYRNLLIEIERARREQIRAVLRSHADVDELEAEVVPESKKGSTWDQRKAKKLARASAGA